MMSTPAPRRPEVGFRARTSVVTAPHVLREYALLADGERGAVIGPHGDIAWLCVPRWDSGAIFSSLIGGTSHYTVQPDAPHVWGGYYEDGSMIWHNRWTTNGGIVECRDALAFPGDPHRTVLLRQLRAVDAPAQVTITLCPRADYDQNGLIELRRHDQSWTGRCGALYLRWTGAAHAVEHENGRSLMLRTSLQPGQQHELILEISDQTLPSTIPTAADHWRTTEAAWQLEIPRFEAGLASTDARHSYTVLRGLTSTSGGMVAAATTSLPERAEAGRNYDYRYVWIRDECYAGLAAAAAGAYSLLDSAVAFVAARILEHGDRLAPAYTVTGRPVPNQGHLGLPGYPGGFDIIGNWVNKQFQLDAYGEALQLFAAAASQDRLDVEHWQAAQLCAQAIGRRWREPDAGIWEIEPRAWTHSRLTAAGGLKAMAALRFPGAAADWVTLADRIVADTSAHALHSDGYWQRSPDDRALDGALLLPGLRGGIPADDPRTIATLDAYLRDLTIDGYAYRFRHDDRPLPAAEGSFLLCGFLTAWSLHQQGRLIEARGWFERTNAACGPARLFSEEYDTQQRQMRGNLPQAFVHALMIETSARLAKPGCTAGPGERA